VNDPADSPRRSGEASPADSSRRSGEAAKADHSEVARQLVHVSMGGFALLLRWITWPQALALAGGALLFNVFVLPLFAARLYRPGDRPRSLHGIVFYPLSVLILLLLFPARLDIVAAAWGILAAGDGIATLAGRAIGGPRWPWNPDKTVAGTLAFFVAGTAAGVFLAIWCRPVQVPVAFALAAVPIAAVTAALVETIPIKLDDNLSVALSAGAMLWIVSLVVTRHASRLQAAFAPTPHVHNDYIFTVTLGLQAVVAANVAVAVAGYAARTVSIAGAVTGAIIGTIIFVSLGWRGWTLLLVTFIAASIASRLGLARKQRLGIDEDRGGRRGPGNAVANTGAAAIAALLAGLDVHPEAARLAFVAALVTAGSDTIASEIGKAFGRRTFSITSFSRVPAGTSGAMSLEGTAAGVLGALGLAAGGAALGLVPAAVLPVLVIGATAGALVESWLGATLEGPGILNNDVLNFINSAAGIAVALGLWRWLR
jgi:uncharacterized protein (TIGR00297 family)